MSHRPILSQMIKDARVANKERPLPSPQDIKLRMKKNQTLRISLTRFPIDEISNDKEFPDLEKKPVFSGGYRHYVDPKFHPSGEGGYVLCKGRGQCSWCRHFDDDTSYSRLAIATTVVVWPTLYNGEVDHKALYRGVFDVMPWIFGQKIYRELSIIQDEFPLGEFDLTLNCDREKYQRMVIRPAKGNMYRKLLTVSKDREYWKAKGFKPSEIEDKMSYYGGICSSIIQDTVSFTKLIPQVLGKEKLI